MGSETVAAGSEHVLRLGTATSPADVWETVPYQQSNARIFGVTHGGAEHWFREWERTTAQPAQLGVVSTNEQTRSATRTADGSRTAPLNFVVEEVAGPGALTDLALVLDDYATQWSDEPANPVIWVDSLGPLLDAANHRNVCRFLHTLRTRLNDLDGRLFAGLDPTGYDAADVAALKTAFSRIDREFQDVTSSHE